MSKLVLLTAIMAAGASAVAITQYVSPATSSDAAVPAIHVDLSAATVMRTLEALTADKYFAHMASEVGSKPADLTFNTERLNDQSVRYTIKFGAELIADIKANIHAIDHARSEVDIVVSLNNSKFAKHNALHPFDVKAMESILDLAVTDYVNSIIKSQRMASKAELEAEITRRLGFSKDQAIGLNHRIEKALQESYADEFAFSTADQRQSEGETQSYYTDKDMISGNPAVNPEGADLNSLEIGDGWSYQAGDAEAQGAEAAAEAASRAGDAAAEAGKAAARAARAAR
jgi:hypothetical protein